MKSKIPKLRRLARLSPLVVGAALLVGACGGGGGGSLPSSLPTSGTGPSTTGGEGTTSTRPDRTTTTRAPDSTTERTTEPSTTEAPGTTEAPRTTEAASESTEETAAAAPAEEGDTGSWWLLVLLLVVVVGVIAWLAARRHPAPSPVPPAPVPGPDAWHLQLTKLIDDLDTASYSLVAGADPKMRMPDDRWESALAQCRQARASATAVGAAAPTPDAADAVSMAAQLLGTLEVDAAAARLDATRGTGAEPGQAAGLVPLDVERLQAAMQRLRDLAASQPPQA